MSFADGSSRSRTTKPHGRPQTPRSAAQQLHWRNSERHKLRRAAQQQPTDAEWESFDDNVKWDFILTKVAAQPGSKGYSLRYTFIDLVCGASVGILRW